MIWLTCPVCSGEVQRVYHAVPVIYKGSGFYTTDYGRPKTRVDNNKEGTESKPSSDDKSAKSSDSKSDTKSESTTSSSNGPSTSESTT